MYVSVKLEGWITLHSSDLSRGHIVRRKSSRLQSGLVEKTARVERVDTEVMMEGSQTVLVVVARALAPNLTLTT